MSVVGNQLGLHGSCRCRLSQQLGISSECDCECSSSRVCLVCAFVGMCVFFVGALAAHWARQWAMSNGHRRCRREKGRPWSTLPCSIRSSPRRPWIFCRPQFPKDTPRASTSHPPFCPSPPQIGTWKSGVSIVHTGIRHPSSVMKNVIPIVMAGGE